MCERERVRESGREEERVSHQQRTLVKNHNTSTKHHEQTYETPTKTPKNTSKKRKQMQNTLQTHDTNQMHALANSTNYSYTHNKHKRENKQTQLPTTFT